MRRSAQFGTWIIIAMLSVVTLVLYVDNKRTRDCIADYMTKDNQNTSNRAAIVDSERDAFLQTLKVLGDRKATVKERTDSFNGYIALVDRNNVVRKQNPILPVPTECD